MQQKQPQEGSAAKQEKQQLESKSIQPGQKQPSGEATPAQGDRFHDIENSQIRKIIAQRLLESKTTVPHYYIKATADLDAATNMRSSMKAQGTKVAGLQNTMYKVSLTSSSRSADCTSSDSNCLSVYQGLQFSRLGEYSHPDRHGGCF